MAPDPKSKKKYFKKEKKSMQPKRHKAPSEKAKSVKEKGNIAKQPQKLQFPNIFRLIPETFSKFKLDWNRNFTTRKLPLLHLGISLSLLKRGVGKQRKKEIIIFDKGKLQKDTFYQRNFWMTCLLGTSIGFALFLSWEIVTMHAMWQQAQNERAQLLKDLDTWEAVTQRYPTYRDAYFESAVLAYQLGETQKEQAFLQKLQQIDPNFGLAQELEKISRGI